MDVKGFVFGVAGNGERVGFGCGFGVGFKDDEQLHLLRLVWFQKSVGETDETYHWSPGELMLSGAKPNRLNHPIPKF